jgi:hypothetical protein
MNGHQRTSGEGTIVNTNMLRIARTWGARAALAIAVLGAPTIARAQSAIIYGSLGNFDISNDTGLVCHGFEIDVDGLTPADAPYSFSANRYGAPQVTSTATGIAVRWATTYDPATGTWADRTVQHTVPWFPGQCYQWTGPATYESSGCEHFGVGAIANPTGVSSHWLCEDAAQPGVLVPASPPTAVPFASYYVAPPVAPGNPPQVVVEVQAPQPAEAPNLFGDAQWIRFFVTQLPVEVTLDQLVADNAAVVPMDAAQLESNYAIIQDEPAAGGNGKRKRKRNQGNLLPTTRSVVRRIETWEFTGAYDPITHEALCADGTCNAPAPDEIGNLISTQMTVALVQSDSVTVTKSGTGSGNVDSADKRIACGSKCVAPYDNGQLVTLTAKSASGSTFGGWSGACAGLGATCTVSAVGHVDVGATFTASAPAGGGGGGGGDGGGGGAATQFTLQVGRSNSGTVTATPTGVDRALNCGSACSAKFSAGTVVTLTATPPAGKQFLGWGGACSGTASSCALTVNANVSVQANFIK